VEPEVFVDDAVLDAYACSFFDDGAGGLEVEDGGGGGGG
jgi:hypothetical protein